MNSAQLLTHFDRISDAPDAIPRLRRFILDLAVRGKLVEQDPRDELASELLKRIKPEGARGEEKTKSLLPELGDGDALFELPHGWCWVRFGQIYSLEYGDNLPAEKRSNTGEYPVYGSNGVVGTHSVCFVREPCIVVGRKGSAGALNLSVTKGCCVTDVAYYCIPPRELDLTFSFKLFHTLGLDTLGKGIKPGLSRNEVYVLPVAVPPFAEQNRIVAKVDELMALCDRLEAAHAERENRRDRLVASSLNRLNNGADPDAFRDHARFYFNHLPRLTTKPEHIQQLRHTILNLAVRGKLVPQDSSDEPASELLLSIEEQKLRLAKEKKIKRPNARFSVDHDAAPYKLPATWEWVRLGELCQFENGDRSHNYPSGSDIKDEGVPFISTKNIVQHKVRLENLHFITEEKFKSLRCGKLMDRDILIVLRGSVGKLGLFEASDRYKTGFINAQLLILRNYHPKVVHYCLTYLTSQIFQNLAFEQSSGSAQPQLSAGNLSSVLIPLPPLAEQQRIVAKVEELMALCDRLEAQLATTQTESRRLLEAVLHEALAPAV